MIPHFPFRFLILKRILIALVLLQLPWAGQAQEYRIPVVVHVLHQNGWENVSDAQILDGLSILNTIFNEGFGAPIMEPFGAIVAQMDVQFCLASLAPDGSATTGINRIETPLTNQGGTPASYIGQWPPERYLNIWLVREIDQDAYDQGSFLPEDAEVVPEKDGVMLRHSYFGSIGTSYPAGSRSIGLMVGRYLGLKLLWEDPTGVGECGDDEVADTPETSIILTCSFNFPSCIEGMNSNVQNYMTYSYCSVMFTQGQKERVHGYLNSDIAQRNNLWSATNLGLTGCGPSGGVDRTERSTIEVHPNPFTDRIVVSGKNGPVTGVQLMDALGRLVIIEPVITGTTVVLDTPADLPFGTYVLRVEYSSGVETSMVVKN